MSALDEGALADGEGALADGEVALAGQLLDDLEVDLREIGSKGVDYEQ